MLLFIFRIYMQKKGLAKKMSERQAMGTCLWQSDCHPERKWGVRVDWGRGGSEGGIPEKAPILELANGFADSLTGAEKVQVPGVVQVGAEELDISLFDEV
jgi:hypothetical protein